jgi:hypothetical protein
VTAGSLEIPSHVHAGEGAEILSERPYAYAFHVYTNVVFALVFVSGWLFIERSWSVERVIPPLGIVSLLLAQVAHRTQFKHVALLGPCLIVWDKHMSVHIPVGEVVEVSQSVSRRPVVITFVLRHRSVFGQRIRFIPKRIPVPFSFQNSPPVLRLRALAEKFAGEICPHGPADV